MKLRTQELMGRALDWAVAMCEGATELRSDGITWGFQLGGDLKVLAPGWSLSMSYCPSSDWAVGGPILEREHICPEWLASEWKAERRVAGKPYAENPQVFPIVVTNVSYGPEPLIASMRCYVASKLGAEIDIPDALLPAQG